MVLLAILGGMMVSYTRARAEGLGLRCEIGWLQRPERFVLLGFGSIFSSIAVHLLGGSQRAADGDDHRCWRYCRTSPRCSASSTSAASSRTPHA